MHPCAKKGQLILFLALTLLLAVAPQALAQKKEEFKGVDFKKGTVLEIAPHSGIMSGSGLFGIKLGMNYGTLSMEVSAEQVIGQTANLYPIALNFAYNFATSGRLLPYATAGGGLFMTVPTNALGAETVSTMGGNFGGGVRYFFSERFGFRLEGRQFVTSVTSKLNDQSELLMFQEIALGVTFLFH